MNRGRCISEDRLIDYVEGVVAGEERAGIERHLGKCPACAACVAALRRTFEVAGTDKVPEPDPAYWAYFAGNVRKRVESRSTSRRRRLRLVLIPGLATAAACLLIAVLYTRVFMEPVGNVEDIIADLNASVVTEEILLDSGMDELFIGQIGADAGALDEYLIQTGDIGEVVGELSEDEERDLINKLNSVMELRGSIDKSMRKGC